MSKAVLDAARHSGDYRALVALIPYAGLLGIEVSGPPDDLLFRLPASPDLIGNPLLPALHGGVIAGFMDLCAALALMIERGDGQVPKIIDFSIDYLRAAGPRDTWARCRLLRQGARIANVSISAWQHQETELVASARCHFKLGTEFSS